jgi:hypothetical protein
MALLSYGRCMGSSRLQGGRGATVSCGDGSNFLFADQHDAEIESPDRGDGFDPYWPKRLPPPTGGHPRIRSRNRGRSQRRLNGPVGPLATV